jgi:hypothetical protein
MLLLNATSAGITICARGGMNYIPKKIAFAPYKSVGESELGRRK